MSRVGKNVSRVGENASNCEGNFLGKVENWG